MEQKKPFFQQAMVVFAERIARKARKGIEVLRGLSCFHEGLSGVL